MVISLKVAMCSIAPRATLQIHEATSSNRSDIDCPLNWQKRSNEPQFCPLAMAIGAHWFVWPRGLLQVALCLQCCLNDPLRRRLIETFKLRNKRTFWTSRHTQTHKELYGTVNFVWHFNFVNLCDSSMATRARYIYIYINFSSKSTLFEFKSDLGHNFVCLSASNGAIWRPQANLFATKCKLVNNNNNNDYGKGRQIL